MSVETIRVLHVVDSLAPGGLENGVVNVARRLHGHGFDIHAACLRFRGEFAARMPEPEKVVVVGKTRGFSLKAARALRRHMKATRADLLHSHNLGTLIYAALASLGGRTLPIVHGEHGQLQKQDLTLKRLWQRRLLFSICRSIHGVSSSVRDNLQSLGLDPQRRVVVTPNGVDCERFRPAVSPSQERSAAGHAPHEFVVGIVGRLVALKRHALLFDALSLLGAEHPGLKLLVVGDGGAEREALIHTMQTHPLAARIRWAGHQDDLLPYYRSMDLLAAPSEIEGLSNAVLEAMACGVPVLAHSACGNAEVIRAGENGCLSEMNTAADMACALREILANTDELRRLGACARDTVVRRFSMDAMAEGYRQIYRQAVT
ncbi:glycosyltransferase [Prosthecobacter sp.]|uniref:glycosyltransferase n=1 Tax=Prosthecobacter sp. TaxID=1965333 RepID=UPI00378400C9